MLDINLLRDKPEIVREALRVRQMETTIVDRVLQFDQERRGLLSQVEVMKAERNAVSKEIGRMKEPAERQAKIDAMRVLGDTIASLDEKVREVDNQLQEWSRPSLTYPTRERRTVPASTTTSCCARLATCLPLISPLNHTGTLALN